MPKGGNTISRNRTSSHVRLPIYKLLRSTLKGHILCPIAHAKSPSQMFSNWPWRLSAGRYGGSPSTFTSIMMRENWGTCVGGLECCLWGLEMLPLVPSPHPCLFHLYCGERRNSKQKNSPPRRRIDLGSAKHFLHQRDVSEQCLQCRD